MKLTEMVFTLCSFSLIFFVALAHAAPTSSGDGELTNDCLQQKTKLQNCKDSQMVTQFYFDSRQNRCRGYHTCPLPSNTPNLFQSRAECTATCPATSCAVPRNPPTNATQILVEHDNGIVNLRYSCLEGYRLAGVSERTCQHDGEWSGTAQPDCTIQCPVLEDIENGKTQIFSDIPGAIDPGTTAVYLCNKGTWNTKNHNYVRLCQTDGTWSGQPSFCGKLEIRYNNTVISSNSNITVMDGERLEFDCVMTPRFPQNASVKWESQSVGDRAVHWRNDKSAFSLEMNNVSTRHNGDYVCKVIIDQIPVDTQHIYVKVQHNTNELNIIGHPSHFNLGNVLVVFCIFHGTSKPQVTWKHNNITIETNDRISVSDHLHSQYHTFSSLRILNPTPADSGKYVCQGRVDDKTIDSNPVDIQISAQDPQRSRRSLSPAAAPLSSPQFQIESVCKKPATGVYLGKMVRQINSRHVHLLIEDALHTGSSRSNRQLASGKLIRTYLQHTSFPLARQEKYFFVIRTSRGGEYTLTAAYHYSQELETFLSVVCPQHNH